MKRTIKVSIIIPIYNAEQYIRETINAVIKQTYNNFELICVNDGSTDNSLQVCKEFANDSRIKIIDKKNGGLASARNSGIENSTGELIFFLDNDDWIDENCIESCVREFYKYNDLDCVIFPYIREFKNISKKKYILGDKDRIYNKHETVNIRRRFFGLQNQELEDPMKLDELNTAWGKMYKREAIANHRFVDAKIIGTAEDCWFNAQVFKNIKKASYITTIFYHYNKKNETSMVHTFNRDLKWVYEKRKNLHDLLQNCIDGENLDSSFAEGLQNRKAITVFSFIRNVANSNLSFKEKKCEISKILGGEENKESLSYMPLKRMKIIWKLYFWLCKSNNSLLLILYTNLAERMKTILR